MYRDKLDVKLDWDSIRRRMHSNPPPYLDACDGEGSIGMTPGGMMVQPIGNAWKILSRSMRKYNSGDLTDSDSLRCALGPDSRISSGTAMQVVVDRDFSHFSIRHIFTGRRILVQIAYRGSTFMSRIHLTARGVQAYAGLLERLDSLIPDIEEELKRMICEALKQGRVRKICMTYIESCMSWEFRDWDVVQMFHMYGIEPYRQCADSGRAIYFHLDSYRGRHVLWAETGKDSFQMRVEPERIGQQLPVYIERLRRFLKNREERRMSAMELRPKCNSGGIPPY